MESYSYRSDGGADPGFRLPSPRQINGGIIGISTNQQLHTETEHAHKEDVRPRSVALPSGHKQPSEVSSSSSLNGGNLSETSDQGDNKGDRAGEGKRRKAKEPEDEYLRRPYCEHPDPNIRRESRIDSGSDGQPVSRNAGEDGYSDQSAASYKEPRSIDRQLNSFNDHTCSNNNTSGDYYSRSNYHRRNSTDHWSSSCDPEQKNGIVRSGSRRIGPFRQCSEDVRTRRRRGNGGGVRHYTTLGAKDENSWNMYEGTSLRSTPSRASGVFSGHWAGMSSRFIYESDPFESALKRCPKVALAVVERATTPVSIEIVFGNPQKQMLPSYYYAIGDRQGSAAVSRRTPHSGSASRASNRSNNSSQSLHIGDRSLPSLDSPRPHPAVDPTKHQIADLIPEEIELNEPQKPERTDRMAKSASSRFVNTPHSGCKQRTQIKRPPKSPSAKSIGLPGKPMTPYQ